MSPALRKILKALGYLAYAGAALLLFVVTAYAAFSVFVRSGATPVPDVAGLTADEARGRLADTGLRLVVEQSGRFDDEVASGHVLEQTPSPRTLVKRGSTVSALLSLGPQRLTVPDLAGRSFQAAQVTLASNNLALGRTLQVYSADVPSGTVVAQVPTAGAVVPPDGTVDLMLSQGGDARRYVMPDLVYRDYDRVRRFFERAGLRLGRVTFELYEGVPAGTVLRQFPLAGHPLTPQDAVSLVVAADPDELEAGAAAGGADADRSERDPRPDGDPAAEERP
jgi:serine/threonine-protein kinase